MPRKVPHQITLVAFQTNEDGSRSVFDICETSFRFASHFARGFMRNPEVSSFRACAPHTAFSGREMEAIMIDLLIRAALIFTGLSVFLVALTTAFAPHIFFVALRFVAGGVAIVVAVAFALAALLCAGLAHTDQGANSWTVVLALAVIVIVAYARRPSRSASPSLPPPAAPSPTPAPSPAPAPMRSPPALARDRASPAVEDAEAALCNLGYSVREARAAVASALAVLDEDASASAIVRAALRARGKNQ